MLIGQWLRWVTILINMKHVYGRVYCTSTATKYSKTFNSYYCKDHETCCVSGCCEKIYAVWYVWVLVVFSIFLCCAIAWFIKRKKMRKRKIHHGVFHLEMMKKTSHNASESTAMVVIGGVRLQPHQYARPSADTFNNGCLRKQGQPEPPPAYEALHN